MSDPPKKTDLGGVHDAREGVISSWGLDAVRAVKPGLRFQS